LLNTILKKKTVKIFSNQNIKGFFLNFTFMNFLKKQTLFSNLENKHLKISTTVSILFICKNKKALVNSAFFLIEGSSPYAQLSSLHRQRCANNSGKKQWNKESKRYIHLRSYFIL
jgi:hypothetical protein